MCRVPSRRAAPGRSSAPRDTLRSHDTPDAQRMPARVRYASHGPSTHRARLECYVH
jgi:hypothetical protein